MVHNYLSQTNSYMISLSLSYPSRTHSQAKLRAESLLMESSVLSSWITEAGLSVQALAKKAKKPLAYKTKLAATKEVRMEIP